MFIQYGSHQHQPGEIQLSISKETLFTDADTPYATRERWDMSGMLVGDDQSDINSQVSSLLNAYSQDSQDLTLKLTEGGDSHLRLRSRDCIGGTRVIAPPSFPDNSDAAYVTFLPYTVAVEGIVALANPATALLSFSETIVRSGGGPRFGLIEPLIGRPIKQLLKRNTIFRAVQRGTATGLYQRPVPPLPLWPDALKQAPEITLDSPRVRGAGASLTYTHFTISWQYEFESATPLLGSPHAWGTV